MGMILQSERRKEIPDFVWGILAMVVAGILGYMAFVSLAESDLQYREAPEYVRMPSWDSETDGKL